MFRISFSIWFKQQFLLDKLIHKIILPWFYFFHYTLILLKTFLKIWVLDMLISALMMFFSSFLISGSKMHELLLTFTIFISRPTFKTGFICAPTFVDIFYSWAFKSQNTAKKLEEKSWGKWSWYWHFTFLGAGNP